MLLALFLCPLVYRRMSSGEATGMFRRNLPDSAAPQSPLAKTVGLHPIPRACSCHPPVVCHGVYLPLWKGVKGESVGVYRVVGVGCMSC
jgi:hypothetical protein